MAEAANGGDHDYVAHDQELSGGYLPPAVAEAELDAISKRRQHIRETKYRDRTTSRQGTSGVAISGGGVRSASFGLGALQALHAYSGIEGIDYLSTESGGGYIGCSLTAAMQDTDDGCRTAGKFPFLNSDDSSDYADTDAVRHIRDFSNYLIPHGAFDVATALGIIGRGFVANILIVLPVLLFFVELTLLIHPTVDSLGKPVIDAISHLPLLASLHGYWFTAILVALNFLFLFLWAIATSVNLGSSGALRGKWVDSSKILFLVTLTTAFFETQPFILWIINRANEAGGTPGSPLHASLHDLWSRITSYLTALGAILGSMGTLFAIFSKYLGDVVAIAKRATGWQAWFKKLAAMAALWIAGLLVPILLWLLYLWLVDIGLGRNWAWWYLAAFLISTLAALFVNPNRTSLYGLYRDRLSKAFLFDPDGQRRDKYNDLRDFDPDLNCVSANYCPYPIVNAALNIEGSQYANKRGRNADFFVFTPEYCGSDATGYIGTKRIKVEATAPGSDTETQPTLTKKNKMALKLGTAMAISGAAVSSNMGSQTIKPLAFTLGLLNIRLGYWLANPCPDRVHPPISRPLDWLTAQLYRLQALFYSRKCSAGSPRRARRSI
jgi:hypothetical protein